VFSDRALNFLERTIWKQTETDKKMLTDWYAHAINRYATGLGALLLSVFMLFLFFNSVLGNRKTRTRVMTSDQVTELTSN